MPLPYYIDFGRHFVLLPMFGGLMNASAGLTWHLRRMYRRDWDRSVDGREKVFRDDLREFFPSPRYLIPDRGVRLRRADGSELTDVDAIVLDHQTGRLALIQLKWPDTYGRSIAERNSRRINLLKANEWVGRVSQWIGGRSAGEVSAVLGIGSAGSMPPALLVLARHAARFSGEAQYDARAHWLSWPSLVRNYHNSPGGDVLGSLEKHRVKPKSRVRKRKPIVNVHRFPSLTVEVHTP
jgi:hypothetical protein